MLNVFPSGNMYMYVNEIKKENHVAFMDGPEADSVKMLFKNWPKAKKLIYVRNGKVIREYLRSDYVKKR